MPSIFAYNAALFLICATSEQGDQLRTILNECMESFRESVHEEMQNIHLELVRQFHIQESGFGAMLQQLDERFERYTLG